MIISLADAQLIDLYVTQSDLDAYEQKVRQLTNNNFQNIHVRYTGLLITDGHMVHLGVDPEGLRAGNTIQVSQSRFNDGLYTIAVVNDDGLALEGAELFNGNFAKAFITKVEYPADIRQGVEGLIRWNKEMGSKNGIKSETIARMSMTYYDVNASDNVDGFPAAKLSFLKKYEKMRWG